MTTIVAIQCRIDAWLSVDISKIQSGRRCLKTMNNPFQTKRDFNIVQAVSHSCDDHSLWVTAAVNCPLTRQAGKDQTAATSSTLLFSTLLHHRFYFSAHSTPIECIAGNRNLTEKWMERRTEVRSQKKNTTLFGNFSQHGGGVFPIPKTFVNLPSIFLYAKFILRC